MMSPSVAAEQQAQQLDNSASKSAGKTKNGQALPSIYIANLPVDATKEKVAKHFSSIADDIHSIVVKSHPEFQKAHAFINLKSQKFINHTISNFNGSLFDGLPIKVKLPMQSKSLKSKQLMQSVDETMGNHLLNKNLNDSPSSCILEHENLNVYFTHLNRANLTFYAIDKSKVEDMENICTEIEEQSEFFLEKKSSMPDFKPLEPKLGHFYAAKFSQDGKFYRGQVEKVHNDESCPEQQIALIRFIDFGNTDLVSHSDLFELPKKLIAIAPMCTNYKLKDLEAPEDPKLLEEAADFVTEQLDSNEIVLSKVFVNEEDKPMRHVICMVGEKDLGEVLLSKNLATKSIELLPDVQGDFDFADEDSVLSEKPKPLAKNVAQAAPVNNPTGNQQRAYMKVPPTSSMNFFGSKEPEKSWEDSNPYSNYQNVNAAKPAALNGNSQPRSISINNQNGLREQLSDLQIKIVSLNQENQTMREKLAKLNASNHMFEDSARITFDALKETFEKIKAIENSSCSYSVEHLNLLINIQKFLSKYTILDVDEVETLYLEIEEREKDLKSALENVTKSPKDTTLVEAKNQAIIELSKSLKAFLEYVYAGKLSTLLETFNKHSAVLEETFGASQNKNLQCDVEENNIRSVLKEIQSELSQESKSFISDNTKQLISDMKDCYKQFADLTVANNISSTFVKLRLSVINDETAMKSAAKSNASLQIESIAALLLKSLNVRCELIVDIISKESKATQRFQQVHQVIDSSSDSEKVLVPTIDSITEVSKQNRLLIKEQLQPLLLDHSYDINENSSSNETSEELATVRNQVIASLESEDALVAEIAARSGGFFPELCDSPLIKDFVKFDGLVKKRHFDYFNTKTVVDGKSWRIVSPEGAIESDQMINRVVITENFSKSADDYIAVALQWNRVSGDKLAKLNYLFLDKMNFSIYYLVKQSSVTFADLIGSNFDETVYPGMTSESINEFKKQSLHSLIKTIASIHEANLIHGEIKPSNIFIQQNDSKLFMLAMPRMELATKRRIDSTRSYFMSMFGYSQNAVPNSHFFDISCFALTLAASITDQPLSPDFQKSIEFATLPDYLQTMILSSKNHIPSITQLLN